MDVHTTLREIDGVKDEILESHEGLEDHYVTLPLSRSEAGG